MKQIYLTKKINKLVSTILVLLGLKEESLGLTTTRASRSLINYDSRNSFGLYSFKAALVFLFFVSSVQGQTVAQYAFGTGTGGTLNAMTGSTQLVASAQDDTASSVTSIGFTFTYAGTAYTQFSVNANGLMRLGSTAASSSSTGYTNSATNAGSNTPAIMPYWDDLHTGVGGKVHYLLTGTAPNRSLIVEWFVTVPRSTTASANAKFQCKLDETTNVVTFTYGSGMVANTTNSGASIGLATSSTVYNNVTTTSNTNSTSTFNTANTSAITSGVFYTFTPPVACVAPANQATALVFGTTTNAAIAGSFTAAASSPSGYLVVRSTSSTLSSGPVDGTTYASAGALGGGTVVQTPGSGLTFSDSGLTANTQYYYFIYDYNNTGCTGGPKYLTTSPLSSSKITCPAAPTAPVNSGVTDSGGTVSWTAPAGGSAASVTYTFEVYTDAARTVAFGSPVTGLTTPTYTIASGLTSGTTYYFKIKANNGSCDSAYLSTGTFTTLALAPTITSFTPSVLCTQGGQTVTISGTNLTGATAVSFNGVAAASFVVVNSTTVTAVVPVGVTDGTVTLTNPANTATSGSSYTSAPTPTISAGSPVTICSGQSTTLTGTGGATYTWSPSTGLSATTGTSVTASPTATTTYTVTGASAAGCTATATVTVTVNATPSAISVSKNPTSVCAGSVTTLTATGGTVGGSMTGTIGTGLLLTSATSQPTAFDNRWSNDWRQTIYTAADLTAAGLIAGNITSLAYNVTTLGDAATNASLNIKIGTTALSTFPSATYVSTTGFTNVYGPSTYTHTASGWQTITFTTPYVWDGVSNIIVHVTMNGANATNNTITYYTATAGNTTIYTTSGYTAGTTTAGSTSTTRLDTRFTGTNSTATTFDWTTNTSDLFANSGATTAYTNQNIATAYSKSTSAQTYTVTSTLGSCSSTGSVTVTPNALPTIGANSATNCAGGSGATLTATGGSTYAWAPSAGLSATTGTSVTATPSATTTYTITGTDANGCISTGTSTVTVNTAVSITSQPSSQVVLENDPVSFSVTAGGTGVTYQWEVNDGTGFAPLSGETNATLSIASAAASQNGYIYHCIVSGTAPCSPVTSSSATLTISSVSITAQPANQTICSNGSATYSVTTSGSVTGYQWQVSTNGTTWNNIPGETNASLTLSGFNSANTGTQFRVLLNGGAVTSNTASLTVYDAVTIGTQPASQNVCAAAGSATFTASVTGSGLSYQWQRSTDSGANWTNVGTNSATYTQTALAYTMNGYQYRVTATGTSPCSAVTSSVATLTVSDVTVAASSATICLGSPVTLSATYIGAPGTTSSSWVSATTGSGATSAVSGDSVSVTPTAAGTYVYTFSSTGSTCSFTKTVSVTVSAAPTITTATATPASLCSGSTINLAATSVGIAAGTATIGTGTSLTGATTQPTAFCNRWPSYRMQTVYTATELQAAGLTAGNLTSMAFNITTLGDGATNGGFTVKIANTASSVLSGAFVDTTTGFTTVYPSQTYTHTATGWQTIPFSTPFAWNGTSNIIVEVIHSGADLTNNSITTYTATTGNTVAYTTTASSNAASFSNTRLNVQFGGQVSSNVASTYTWAWTPGSATGATATTSITNTSGSAVTQAFTATATNAAGCTSSLATSNVTINSTIPTPTNTDSTQCGGGTTPTCSVTGSGRSGSTFHWYLASSGGTALAGQTASSLSGYPISGPTTFYVSEVSADGLCESSRATVFADVTTAFAFSLSASTATNCAGSASLTPVTIATNGGYTSYAWSNSATVSGDSTSGWTFSPTTATTYTVTATGGGCSTTATVAVTPVALPLVTVTASPTAVCVGGSSTLTALTTTVASGNITLGAGSTTSTSPGSNPFYGGYGGVKTQYLIKASELTGLGLSAGNITALGLNVTTAGSTLSGFGVSVGATSLSALTTNIETVATSVYSGSFVPTVGLNTITFSTPFNWDGTSNIIVSFCWSNANTSNTVSTVTVDTTSFVSANGRYVDSQSAANVCGYTGSATPSGWNGSSTSLSTRPKFTISGQKNTQGVGTLAYTWNGSSTTGNVLTVSPSATTTYTAYGLNGSTGCTGSASATVTLFSPPTAPVATNGTRCGTGIVTAATVADTNSFTTPTFKWYADNSTTTALQTSTSTSYTISISATTTLYVSVVSPGGCESTRTAITLTVNTPATLTVSPAVTVCTGGSATLTASGAVSYTWSPALGLNGTTSASVVATPSATTTYSVTGVDGNGCTTAAATVKVTVAGYPSAVTVTNGATQICVGSAMSLTATGGTVGSSGSGKIGSGTAANTGSTPYKGYYGGQRTQQLYTAAELTALGLSSSSSISSLGFVSLTGTPLLLNGFTVKAGFVSATTLGSAFISGASTAVFSGTTYTPPTGTGNIDYTLSSPITWDGVSSLLIETCFNNNNTGGTSSNSLSVESSTVASGLNLYNSQDSTVDICTNSTTPSSSTNRPNLRVSYSNVATTTMTWTPTTDLYTDSTGNTAYTGGDTSVVYVIPSTSTPTVYTATASNGSCTTAGTTIVTGTDVPVFTLADATICGGSSTTLVATGAGNSYVWSPATTLSSSTGSSVTATPTSTTTYHVVGTSVSTGCSNSHDVTVTVSQPVVITSITPTSNTVRPTQSATYTVAASGTGLTYQWQVDDGSGFVNISGATSTTLTLTDITSGMSGYQYQCIVSGTAPCSPATSATASLAVDTTGIDVQPASTTVCAGNAATFSLTATSDDPLQVITYFWEYNVGSAGFTQVPVGFDATTGLTFTGSDAASLSMTGTTAANTGIQFHCIVNGYIYSSDATLTVKAPVAITSSPSDQTVCSTGGTATFTGVATGDNLAYQWQFSTNGTSWFNYTGTGATTASITITNPAIAADGTQYRLVVSGNAACTSATSAAATLHINNPTITAEPGSATIIRGDTATFTVSASAATSYEWQSSTTLNGTYTTVADATPVGNTYTGADTATLSVKTTAATATGNTNFYRCVVTYNGCTATSKGGQLTVYDYCTPTGTTSTSYYLSNVVTTNGVTNISNATTLSTGGYGNYTTTNSCTQYRGSTVSVALTSASQDDYYYCWIDWNNNGSFADAGETIFATTSYSAGYTGTITVPLGQAYGSYRMRVANSYSGTITSCGPSSNGEYEDYTFIVIPTPACSGTPTAGTASAVSASLCSGNSGTSLTLTGSSSGVTGITYQWQMSTNGTTFSDVSGATSITLTTGALSATTYYQCNVTCANSAITSTSNVVTLTVSNPQITGSTPAGRCGTGTVTLSATANAGSSINWYAAATGGSPLTGGTNTTSFATPSISATTTYYAEAVSGGGSGNASSTYSGTTNNGTSTGSHGIAITTTAPGIKIVSADIPFTGTGTLTIALKDSANSTVYTSVTTGTVTGLGTTSLTIPLNITVPTAGNYLLIVNGVTGTVGGLGYSTVTYPLTALSGTFSVTGGYWYGVSTSNMYLYNLAVSSGCSSERTAVIATVDPKPTATISYAGSPYCYNASPVAVSLNGTNAYTGGTFSSTSGLTIDSATGTIDPSSSTAGTYTITYTTNATTYCTPQTATATVTVNPSVLSAGFTYASTTYCTNSASATPIITGSAGAFTVSPSGLSINATTGAINFATSTPGSYTVTNTVSACSSSDVVTFAITVNQAPVIGTQPASATICSGTNASFTVAATGTSVTYQWEVSTNGTTWTSLSGETSATLAITGAAVSMSGSQYHALVSDTSGCGTLTSSAATLTVSQPTAPVITPSSTNVCTGGIVTLSADPSNVSAYSNSFDALPSSFTVSGTGATATLNTTYQAEGTGSVLFNAGTSADVTYSLNSNLNLSGASTAQLTFSHQAVMEGPTTSYDYGYVQYSADGGGTWTSFPTTSYSGTGTLFNSVVSFSTKSYPDWITAFTGTTSTPSNSLWKSETITIPAAALTSQFRVRFRYTTDSSVNYYGWLIDNVKVSVPNSVAWTPPTGLYTNAGATTAYAGGNVTTLYAKPTATTTYTVTNTNGLGCTNSATVAVTVLAPSTLSSITQPTITCSGAQTTFVLAGLLANSTSTLSYNINAGTTQTITGVVADASGNGSFTLALAGFTNGQTLTVTAIQRTDLTPSCSTTISSGNTVTIHVQPLVTYYADADGDGYGNYNVPQITCQGQPSGYVTNNTDCDDTDPTKHDSFSFYADTDGDGYGAGSLVSVCAVNATTPPSGYSLNNTDCAPTDGTKNASYSFYVDADGDGFGTGSLVSVCAVDASTPPSGYSSNNTDCNDGDSATHTHTTTTTNLTACGSYTWSVNGTTYTTGGTYTYEVNSCHTEVLNLTIACSSVVTVKMMIQGYYAGSGLMAPVKGNELVGSSSTDVDDVTIELRDATDYHLVATTTGSLQTDGNAVATFPALSGSYYIAVHHRNSLETWSANPVAVGVTPTVYDFTTSAAQAFGSNMADLGSGVFGFYSGDINQDGSVNNDDYTAWEEQANNLEPVSYYLSGDLNGDGSVNNDDYSVWEATANGLFYSSTPEHP